MKGWEVIYLFILLNKNLTSEEKKKLQELQVRIEKCHEKASQIWGAQ